MSDELNCSHIVIYYDADMKEVGRTTVHHGQLLVLLAEYLQGEGMTIRVFESNPTYDEWCEANGLDPDDDETYNAYCEWRSNSR